jgi:hypothetical protein
VYVKVKYGPRIFFSMILMMQQIGIPFEIDITYLYLQLPQITPPLILFYIH